MPSSEEWEHRADARLALLQEAVEVLAALWDWDGWEGVQHDYQDREVSPALTGLVAEENMRRDRERGITGVSLNEYLEAMVADGLRVRGRGDG